MRFRRRLRFLSEPVVTTVRLIKPTVLSIAMMLACGTAAASESRHMSADGSASCPDSTAQGTERTELDEPADPTAPAPVRRTEKSRTIAAPRASSGARAAAPRWHSFLPGMFR